MGEQRMTAGLNRCSRIRESSVLKFPESRNASRVKPARPGKSRIWVRKITVLLAGLFVMGLVSFVQASTDRTAQAVVTNQGDLGQALTAALWVTDDLTEILDCSSKGGCDTIPVIRQIVRGLPLWGVILIANRGSTVLEEVTIEGMIHLLAPDGTVDHKWECHDDVPVRFLLPGQWIAVGPQTKIEINDDDPTGTWRVSADISHKDSGAVLHLKSEIAVLGFPPLAEFDFKCDYRERNREILATLMAPVEGVTLEQYARLSAGILAGIPLSDVMEREYLPLDRWEQAAPRWKERMDSDGTKTLVKKYSTQFLLMGYGPYRETAQELARAMLTGTRPEGEDPVPSTQYQAMLESIRSGKGEGRSMHSVLEEQGVTAYDWIVIKTWWEMKPVSFDHSSGKRAKRSGHDTDERKNGENTSGDHH